MLSEQTTMERLVLTLTLLFAHGELAMCLVFPQQVLS